MTPPLDPRRAGEWWEWECDRCGALHESAGRPAEDERACLFCEEENHADQ